MHKICYCIDFSIDILCANEFVKIEDSAMPIFSEDNLSSGFILKSLWFELVIKGDLFPSDAPSLLKEFYLFEEINGILFFIPYRFSYW